MSRVRSVGRVPHRAVDDQPHPAVVDTEAGDDVADQRGVQRAVTVDDEHSAVTRFGENRFQQRVVLETLDGGDRAGELRAAAELAQLQIAAADVGADLVDQVGGGAGLDGHRSMLAIGLVRSLGSMLASA